VGECPPGSSRRHPIWRVDERDMKGQPNLWGYLARFAVIHTITYVVAGVVFMNLQSYAEVFEVSQQFAHFRSLDSPIVRAAPLIQLLRGGFFALLLYPFYETIVWKKRGWLALFGLLFGLTYIGAVAATPGSIEGLIYTRAPLIEHLVGVPEVIVQALVFSWLFVRWERSRFDKEELS
jgi:hypothetical protein